MHLRNSGSTITLEQAATVAIRAWIVANPSHTPPPAAIADARPEPTPPELSNGEGYQWKNLFLPCGTDLRMSTRDGTGHARVCGDDIIYNGRKVSPRGLTLAIAGDGRNAWRDLWLRMPGEIDFTQASRCRHQHERLAAGLPVYPYIPNNVPKAIQPCPAIDSQSADPSKRALSQDAPPGPAAAPEPSVAAAAVAMSEAFKTLLALMERLNPVSTAEPMPNGDRRTKHGRREEDILADHCAFD